jgi:hypothetical protein
MKKRFSRIYYHLMKELGAILKIIFSLSTMVDLYLIRQ